jgi:hypothetical protein
MSIADVDALEAREVADEPRSFDGTSSTGATKLDRNCASNI